MRKTLILVIDRDDDFGAKADVVSPVIGFKECTKAATALGIADPEDSDTNALFAALNLYREMQLDPEAGAIEVALICGNQKVGYKSDTALVQQLEVVLKKVGPDRAILVGDGAEDEYIYPIISSRVPVDSVKEVYGKQAAGVEGAFYILKRIIEDPQKRERFIAPIAWVMMIICAIYIVSNLFSSTSLVGFIANTTTIFIFFVVGLLMAFYAYNLEERISNQWNAWKNRASRGSITTVFFAASALVIVVGIVVSIYSLNDVYTTRDTQVVLLFLVYFLWFFLFSILIYISGIILDGYLNSRTVKYTYITLILNIVSVGLIVNGGLDILIDYVGLHHMSSLIYIAEIVMGFVMSFMAALLQMRFRSTYYSKSTPVEGDSVVDEAVEEVTSDEVQ
ncbi:MAG: DUF373 family protein [archaeon]|nr:DUF373 family protein [archaeon]